MTGHYYCPPKHRMSGTRIYNIWKQMRYRCSNPNATGWANYGGRGVKVCTRWEDFEKFYADMGDPPSPQHTLDRYPRKNGHYRPGNCRWATQKEQARNQRKNILLTHKDGRKITLAEAVENLPKSTKYNSVLTRIRRGEKPHEAIRPKRRKIPRSIKVIVVQRQNGFCKCGCGQRIAPRNASTHFDHEPALALRDINADWTDFIPPQHDPAYIDARCIASHKAKTSGTGATTAGTDMGKIKKERRRKKSDKPKRKWKSRGFPPKGSRSFKGKR